MENETEREVLTYRYLRRLQLGKDLWCIWGIQWAQIHRIHANALKNFNPTGVYYQLMIENEESDKDDTQ